MPTFTYVLPTVCLLTLRFDELAQASHTFYFLPVLRFKQMASVAHLALKLHNLSMSRSILQHRTPYFAHEFPGVSSVCQIAEH